MKICLTRAMGIALILPILLFLSIGFSTWSFGPNLVQNPNFTDATDVKLCSTLYWNESYSISCGFDNSNPVGNLSEFTALAGMADIGGDLSGWFYWSFKWKPTILSVPLDSETGNGLIQTHIASSDYTILLNTTNVCSLYECPSGFPAFMIQNSTQITSLGDDWYQFETIINATQSGAEQGVYIESYGETPDNILVDDFVAMVAIWTAPYVPPITAGAIYDISEIPQMIVDFIGGIISALADAAPALMWIIVAGIILSIAAKSIELMKKMKK